MWETIIGIAAGLGIGALIIKILVSAYEKYVLKHVFKHAYDVGAWISKQGRKRMGENEWEKVEDGVLNDTLDKFTAGIKAGWNSDDSE